MPTRAELIRIAKSYGIRNYCNMTKPQLTEAIAKRRALLAQPATKAGA